MLVVAGMLTMQRVGLAGSRLQLGAPPTFLQPQGGFLGNMETTVATPLCTVFKFHFDHYLIMLAIIIKHAYVYKAFAINV